MSKCYASHLGDCEGRIEDEHFVSRSLQNILGEVTVKGLAWQKGSSKIMKPGSYSHARIICREHHDQLDGLDGVALSYFKNFMLLAGRNYIATGKLGDIRDITPIINGRALEKWFMKTICGAIAAKTIAGVNEVPRLWIEALFSMTPWPDDWAVYISQGTWTVKPEDAALNIEFHWASDSTLNGLVIKAFSVETIFSIVPLDLAKNLDLIRRPPAIGMNIQRPDKNDILNGLPAGKRVIISMNWN